MNSNEKKEVLKTLKGVMYIKIDGVTIFDRLSEDPANIDDVKGLRETFEDAGITLVKYKGKTLYALGKEVEEVI